jgi:hypothetical protein
MAIYQDNGTNPGPQVRALKFLDKMLSNLHILAELQKHPPLKDVAVSGGRSIRKAANERKTWTNVEPRLE